jgi:ElaB/YqjD/DUF883 family membrane-anchored ribosome-binding protein
MAADDSVSQDLKTLHEELSTSRKERAATTSAAAGAASIHAGSIADAPEELTDQLGQFANELKGLFGEAEKSISAHPTQNVVGALLVGILIGRLLGRR